MSPVLGLEGLGDRLGTAELRGRGLAIGALVLGEGLLALLGEPVDEAVVDGAGELRRGGRAPPVWARARRSRKLCRARLSFSALSR